jgi:predicted peroxiredoxin
MAAERQLVALVSALDVPEVPEFFDQVVAAGGHLWACVSADMMKIAEDDHESIFSAPDFIQKTAAPNCCSSEP